MKQISIGEMCERNRADAHADERVQPARLREFLELINAVIDVSISPSRAHGKWIFGALLPCLLSTAHATGLIALVDDARENDAKLKSAESAYRADIEKEAQGRAGLLPQLTAQQSIYRNGVRIPGQSYPGYSTVGLTVSLSQPIFKWDAWETYQQGKLSVIGAGLALEQAQADLLLRVSQAYFDVLAAHDDTTLAGKHKQAIVEQLALTKRRFDLGDATAVDISEAQSAFDSANADEIAAQEELEGKYAALQKIVGHPVQAVDSFRANFSMPLVDPPDIDQWVAAAAEANYEVRQKQIAVEIAEREQAKARSGDYPTVSLIGNVNNGNAAYINGQSNFNTGGNRGTSSAIGIQITLPLTDGLMTRSRIREALALKDKAEHDLDDARRSAELNARQAYLGVTRGTAKVSALQTAVTSAEVTLKSNQVGYRVGVRVNADVLTAQDKLFGVRRDLAKARYETLMEGLHLKASAARLEEADLDSVNALLAGNEGTTHNPQKSASGD